jgi:thiol:disulfide interchange protein
MASQLRLRVLLPVAILGILGLGVGAFATTRSTPETSSADAVAARIAAKQNDKTQKPSKPAAKPSPQATPLQDALRQHSVVVVLFYAPGDDYDTIQARETRAGALAANAGFLALKVTKNKQIAALAAQYDVREAPATLVFTRGPRVAYRVAGYLDRQAVAQAAADARS